MDERSNEITLHVTLPSGEQTKTIRVNKVSLLYNKDNMYRIVQ